MFCFCLLWLGLSVTEAPAENFGTRIHGMKVERGVGGGGRGGRQPDTQKDKREREEASRLAEIQLAN